MNMHRVRTHRFANLCETAIIMAALFSLLILIAWLFSGTTGILITCVAGIPLLLFGGAQAGRLVLRMYRAKSLTSATSPGLVELVDGLARRAELDESPRLFYIPSSVPLAFSVGLGSCGAIALSDGLLRMLTWREIVGVVAHEVSHIAGKDTRVMGVADVASRLVSAISFAGQMLITFNLPLYLLGYAGMPWFPLFVMMVAPILMTLLQLALSRSREFEADRTAAYLTGDPLGLASALENLERFQRQHFGRLLLPYGKVEVPSILRTHPGTAKRIERLVDLANEGGDVVFDRFAPCEDGKYQSLRGVAVASGHPRRRLSGLWY